MSKYEKHTYPKSEFVRHVVKLGGIISREMMRLAEGMWNPNFCSSDASFEARDMLIEIDRIAAHMRQRLAEANAAPVETGEATTILPGALTEEAP